MIATSLATKTSLSRLSLKIQRIVRQPRPLQVKASEVDSYGDYDVEQLNVLPANLAGSNAISSVPDVSAEEFETLYHWYLS